MIIKYAIALAVVLLLAAILAWAFVPSRYLPGNRARHLRIRLHLRLHPGKGFAHVVSLWLRWGRLAALRRSARIRLSLPLRYRVLDPREHSVDLGRAHYRHRLHVPLEEHLLVMSPPRMLKTAFLADVILGYPGPVIATSTKPDVYALTSAVRARYGPVHVFNPQGIGAVPSTFRWSPVSGCEDPATAIRRADAFAFAVSAKAVEDASFWSAKASDYLRGYFHAAALARYDLRTVAAWVSGASPDVPERILMAAGARQWAHTLAELRSEAHKTAATVRMVMSRALAFMADPALAASVLPPRGGGFDIPAFLADRGTVYLIAEAVVIGQRARGGCSAGMWLIQERPPGAVVRAWCPKRSEEDVLWVRVAARRGGTGGGMRGGSGCGRCCRVAARWSGSIWRRISRRWRWLIMMGGWWRVGRCG